MECSLENITVHYEAFGEGRPIILLPGWELNTRLTAHKAECYFQQRTGWKRIYIDPPGHGKTPGKDWIMDRDKILNFQGRSGNSPRSMLSHLRWMIFRSHFPVLL